MAIRKAHLEIWTTHTKASNHRTPIEYRLPGRVSDCQSFTLVTESEERCLRFLEFLGISLSEFRGVDGHTAFEDLKCTEISSCLWRFYALKFAEVDMRTNLNVLLGIKMLKCRPDFQCPQQHFELRSTSISNHIFKHADIGLTEFSELPHSSCPEHR